jgi:hypothetical protein
VDGHTYYPGHKKLLESLPPDMVREMARQRMMAIEAAGASYFPELHTADAKKEEPVLETVPARIDQH